MIDVRLAAENLSLTPFIPHTELIIDRRECPHPLKELEFPSTQLKIISQCPLSWTEIQQQYRQAIARSQKLVLAYSAPQAINPQTILQQLIGLAKYYSRTQKTVTKSKLQKQLNLSDRSFSLGLAALKNIGFVCRKNQQKYLFSWQERQNLPEIDKSIQTFLNIIKEEQFQRQYFYQVPLATINQQLQTVY